MINRMLVPLRLLEQLVHFVQLSPQRVSYLRTLGRVLHLGFKVSCAMQDQVLALQSVLTAIMAGNDLISHQPAEAVHHQPTGNCSNCLKVAHRFWLLVQTGTLVGNATSNPSFP